MIFVFLRRVSATLIPSLALPIAVIGTFAGMSLFGYNLDNLSLMALTLSVGFVVDDAIVMLENIVRHIEMGEKPYEAALKGSREIGFTILSMTVSLAAVFIPIVFMGGIVGRLLHEFAVTIILAILFSGVVSVTLTPMLCARILQGRAWPEAQRASIAGASAASTACRPSTTARCDWSLRPPPLIFLVCSSPASRPRCCCSWSCRRTSCRATTPARSSAHHPGRQRHLVRRRWCAISSRSAAIVAHDPNVEGVMSSVGAGGARTGTNTGTHLHRR